VDLVGSDPLGQVDAEVSKHLALRPAGPAHATKTALAAIDQRIFTSPILIIETVETVCRGHPGILKTSDQNEWSSQEAL